FRSVGYRGAPLPEIPFNDSWGTIANEAGRIIDNGEPIPGLYTAGWIKRGPTGVIGTNKTCAQETVKMMVEDLKAGKLLSPVSPNVDAAKELIKSRVAESFSFDDWSKLDDTETGRGESQGRPRVKFTKVSDMLKELGR
ncbi:MAG: ferredoxin--NADP+ reductase, partial [Dinoroseobacter sp.]